ncbi:MAG TPA: hypothetical protein DEG17_09275 [Cyanobacteria bacterium UBA11149]|nr:hypothetical protein [Cyanobacteria bacterium UBA11367]HBE57499.1 hypothetical protein [Cyanobacteria bacterium UBA11366]HBK66402.1 hypothetical protein [Cyanobacteria bacterium UBA11166]HBR73593.1 hypothetical protein [Cyanobacteria bacterium UBA11159]HBS68106.1 hypothetical protein [Cyanobacteria bacterium UBA11153]HBW89041.1 hypothetical protein [Cyanobacteria bacterium UBA11149]HCA96723.1 hypothetical protein [Cyanobacteria bacterium UBA9226]
MTPQFQAAIAAIQPLSPAERQQLLQILIQTSATNSQSNLKALSIQFWQGITLKQLLTSQTPTTVRNLKDFAVSFWHEEDSIEDFLTFLRQQRQELV